MTGQSKNKGRAEAGTSNAANPPNPNDVQSNRAVQPICVWSTKDADYGANASRSSPEELGTWECEPPAPFSSFWVREQPKPKPEPESKPGGARSCCGYCSGCFWGNSRCYCSEDKEIPTNKTVSNTLCDSAFCSVKEEGHTGKEEGSARATDRGCGGDWVL